MLIGRLIAKLFPLKKEYRVFFFFPFYHTGGAEKVHLQITKASSGTNNIIYFTKKSADDRFLGDFKNTGCTIKDISRYTDNKWLYFLNLIYRGIITGYINSQNQKPVVFNGQCNFGYKISPWLKNDILQIELIHSLNSFSYIRIPFLPFIDKTVMISKKRIDDHYKLYRELGIPDSQKEKIRLIPNAIELPQQVSPKDESSLIVLYVGRGTGEKRVHLIPKIANELKYDDVQFEIMGDVSEALNESQFPSIKFYGNVSDQQLTNSVYSKAHILILTSLTEGFPMVVMESMAFGCAVIATAVGDIPYHIKDNENGFLFTNTDDDAQIINEAMEKIRILKHNRQDLKRICHINILYAKDNFGIDRFNKDYNELLSSVKKTN